MPKLWMVKITEIHLKSNYKTHKYWGNQDLFLYKLKKLNKLLTLYYIKLPMNENPTDILNKLSDKIWREQLFVSGGYKKQLFLVLQESANGYGRRLGEGVWDKTISNHLSPHEYFLTKPTKWFFPQYCRTQWKNYEGENKNK